jgi:hypothetical protein
LNVAHEFTPQIELVGAAKNNGLATMITELITQNLADHPDKRRDFAHLVGRVAIVAEDAGVALTLCFSFGALAVYDGIEGIPDVTVRASSDDVINLSLVELTEGTRLPDLKGEVTQAMLKASRAGRIRVLGALFHIPMLVHLTRVMSVN